MAMEADAASPPQDERSDEGKQKQAEAAISRLYRGSMTPCAVRTMIPAAVYLRVVAEDAPCRSPAASIGRGAQLRGGYDGG